jgi:energy-converting hydrogenase Eha subunit C
MVSIRAAGVFLRGTVSIDLSIHNSVSVSLGICVGMSVDILCTTRFLNVAIILNSLQPLCAIPLIVNSTRFEVRVEAIEYGARVRHVLGQKTYKSH